MVNFRGLWVFFGFYRVFFGFWVGFFGMSTVEIGWTARGPKCGQCGQRVVNESGGFQEVGRPENSSGVTQGKRWGREPRKVWAER